MSQENVEIVHRAYDALNRRDLDSYLALMHDDIEAVGRLAAMEGAYHGHDGIRRWWDSTFQAFPDFTIEAGEMRDYGGVIVGASHMRGHGADSNAPIDQTVWIAIKHRDGIATWWGTFNTRAEALAAVGLSEPPPKNA